MFLFANLSLYLAILSFLAILILYLPILFFDVWPSMVTLTQNLCSEFIPSKVHTHSSEHTHIHCEHTRSSGQPFMQRRLGSSWGFGALLKGTSSWYWRVYILKICVYISQSCLFFIVRYKLRIPKYKLSILRWKIRIVKYELTIVSNKVWIVRNKEIMMDTKKCKKIARKKAWILRYKRQTFPIC